MKNLFIYICCAYLVISSCAKMGGLTGGYKDETPPRVLSSKPDNYSTSFTGQKIEITFDEYIVLKDINRELIISPPLKEKPDVRLKNKNIVIDLKNELRENTTYTINFGKAIADNNEGNAIINYEFVFSTGKTLDSLSIKGFVLNAFDLQPSKDPMNVMLFDKLEDSIPLKEVPVFIGKTDIRGIFSINNLKADTYKIFVLKDQNYNFLFDLPNEEIAFADTFIPLTTEFLGTLPLGKERPDTILFRPKVKTEALQRPAVQKTATQKATTRKKKEVARVLPYDSTKRKSSLPPIYVDMFYFVEDPIIQYLSFNQRKIPENIEFGFSIPPKEEPSIQALNFKPAGSWYLPESNIKRDSFILWLTDTSLISQDTLKIELGYTVLDSLGNPYSKKDSIDFLFRKPIKVKSRRDDDKEKKEERKLIVNTIRNKSILELNKPIPFTFNYPLQKADTSLISLFMTKDSIEHRIPYEIKKDTFFLRKAALFNKWEENTQYRLYILPGAFTDIYGISNDTIRAVFTSNEIESYGILTVNISDVKMPMIIQLMNTKENVLLERFIKKDSKLVFDFLTPNPYLLKFIFDRNGNGKWDTGNYLKNIQPEKVYYYMEEITTIRANWESEINWSADHPE